MTEALRIIGMAAVWLILAFAALFLVAAMVGKK